jgi:arginase
MNVMIYAGPAGDRNERGIRGAAALGARLAGALGLRAETLISRAPIVEGGWRAQLRRASASLRLLAARLGERWDAGDRTILTMGRCAAGLATLPAMARRFPDAAVVWFDAHGDCNVPAGDAASEARYLGGMVLSGAAGEWDTGLGAGLDLANVILVGARPSRTGARRSRTIAARSGRARSGAAAEAGGRRAARLHPSRLRRP